MGLVGLCLWVVALQVEAARLALVIGNRDYAQGALKNPVNDAQAVARMLGPGGLGFDVTLVRNLKRDDVGRTVESFAAKIRPGDEVVFFYAGHGMQVKGVNYLPAVDARITVESDVALNSLNLNELLVRLDEAKAGVRLLFIDACRNNPYGRGFRSGAQGLARVEAAPSGTLMHFATRPGGIADDGEGENGLYTSELLKHLATPGMPIESVLKRVASGVRQASGGAQTPWSEGALDGEFYFVPASPAAAAPTPPAPALPKVSGDLVATAMPLARSEAPAELVRVSPQVPPPAAPAASAAPPAVKLEADAPLVDIVLAGSARLAGRFSRDPGGQTYSGEGRLSWPNGDVYQGQLVAGLREGSGSLAWASGQHYEGDWKADRPEGKGRLRFVGGNLYQGEVVNGMANGLGQMVYASGDRYTGAFRDGEPSGEGEYVWSNGQTMKARFVAGRAEGQATLRLANGDVFVGEVVAGMPNGVGTMSYANRDRYVGAVKDGLPQGDGRYTWASGQWAEGRFVSGQLSGQGRMRFANGNLYEGELKEGLPEGQGQLQYAPAAGQTASDRYVGQFRRGSPHGQGVYVWVNGDRYDGGWSDGLKHGQGEFAWANGDRWRGRYERDAQTTDGELTRRP